MFCHMELVGTATITAPVPARTEQKVDPRGDKRAVSKFNRLKEGSL